MAWEISHSNEIWPEIESKLYAMDKVQLAQAIVDDTIENDEQRGVAVMARINKGRYDKLKFQLLRHPKDILVQRCFELVEQTYTTDNGGNGFWIDREGYHKVWLDD